jgi:hypothetical protein
MRSTCHASGSGWRSCVPLDRVVTIVWGRSCTAYYDTFAEISSASAESDHVELSRGVGLQPLPRGPLALIAPPVPSHSLRLVHVQDQYHEQDHRAPN